MRAILTGGLLEQVQQIEQCGRLLDDRNNWDGRDAQIFSQRWAAERKTLDDCVKLLQQLEQDSARVVRAIRAAGGNPN